MNLARYLDQVAGRDCGYGVLDCAIFVADWLMQCGWPDPMPDRRGTYATERDYRAAIRSEGGLVASCRRRFARIGLGEVVAPHEGDVAVALAPFAPRRGKAPLRLPTGCIVLGGATVALLDWPRGIVGADLQILAAWGHCRG
ncbi:hypothetical protein ABID65_003321 [Bradyrhizobium sp. S3.9.2]|uniref:DUF6950 family protein n=1 Tax=Bradyrhizobium sp. S3.9.2 TaxID=3156432 RepID=UPI003396D6DD